MRGPSVRGARRLTSGGVLEQYGEHGEQAQRSNGGSIVCFARQVVRKAGWDLQIRSRGQTTAATVIQVDNFKKIADVGAVVLATGGALWTIRRLKSFNWLS